MRLNEEWFNWHLNPPTRLVVVWRLADSEQEFIQDRTRVEAQIALDPYLEWRRPTAEELNLYLQSLISQLNA